MVNALKNRHRYNLFLLLGIMSLACFALSLFRVYVTGSPMFLFLNWNLFLAFLPWAFSTWLWINPQHHHRKWLVATLLASWILFFPNAPYILTDLFHLTAKRVMPIWFDLVLILSYAWTGLLFGLLSLMDIEQFLSRFMAVRKRVLAIVGLLFLSAFGIYLGRYLRWNSWDIVQEPYALFADLADRFVNPFAHPRTWGLTLFMGGLLNMMYWSFRLMRKQSS